MSCYSPNQRNLSIGLSQAEDAETTEKNATSAVYFSVVSGAFFHLIYKNMYRNTFLPLLYLYTSSKQDG